MYARYIPPPKAKPPADVEKPVDKTQQKGSNEAQPTSSVTPYARYIPPKKVEASGSVPEQKPTKIVFNDDDFSATTLKKRKLAENEADGKKKGRKEKESKEVNGQPTEGRSELAGHKNEAEAAPEGTSGGKPTDSVEPEDRKSKKKKGSSKDSARRVAAETEAVVPEVPLDSPTQEDGSGSHSRKESKKKRKRVREGETEQAESATGQEQEVAAEARHEALLRKKEKSLKKALVLPGRKKGNGDATEAETAEASKEVDEVHGLVALPQPEPIQLDVSRPTYETLPPWLASPVRVLPQTRSSFSDLGIRADAAAALGARGYKEAFAVQVAAIPLLLPSPDLQGDLAVSAATGSGKTLAYVLPMMQDLSQSVITRLRALIVVPTRELVRQAQEACDLCVAAFASADKKTVKVGIAVGNQAFQQEQAALMEETQRYDPSGYQKYLQRRGRIDLFEESDSEAEMDLFQSHPEPLPDHVVEQHPRVDVLICTPGRLVEHIRQTRGFNLDYVRWLIIDEADKLLGQTYQQWLGLVMDQLSRERFGARDFPGTNKSGVRKVMLSATMTRDLSLLNELKLRRPKLIVLEGMKTEEQDSSATMAGEHTLPDLLEESAIKIRDPNLKPLYLLELLNSPHFASKRTDLNNEEGTTPGAGNTSPMNSDEPESGVEIDSDSDSSASDSSSDSEAGRISTLPSALIFTRSNESAVRLSRLLAILSPTLEPAIGILTSITRTTQRRKTIRAFSSGKIRLLIASDLVARGIDLPNLQNVINYDMPTSVAAYVHRVGRTARAGQGGQAWTLVANNEAAWFWREIGGEGKGATKAMRRRRQVERAKLFSKEDNESHFSEDRVHEYEKALEQLGKEAADVRQRSKG